MHTHLHRGCQWHPLYCDHRLQSFILVMKPNPDRASHMRAQQKCHHRWVSTVYLFLLLLALSVHAVHAFVYHWYIETLCLHSSFLHTCRLIFSMIRVLNSIFSFNTMKIKFLNVSFEEELQLYPIVDSKMQSTITVFRWWLQMYQHNCPTVICVQGLSELFEQCVTRKNNDVFPCETLIL